MNKKIVEDVEAEVERLLVADFAADDVSYEVHERKENEDSDLDEDDSDEDQDAAMGAAHDDEEDGDDFDLNQMIDEALDNDKQDEEDSDEDDEDDEESDGDLEEEDPDEKNEENELKIQVFDALKRTIYIQANALKHEITALEVKLAEKEKLASNQVNVIMKVISVDGDFF